MHIIRDVYLTTSKAIRNTVPTAGTSQAALGSANPLCEGFLLSKMQIQKRATLTDSTFSNWESAGLAYQHCAGHPVLLSQEGSAGFFSCTAARR